MKYQKREENKFKVHDNSRLPIHKPTIPTAKQNAGYLGPVSKNDATFSDLLLTLLELTEKIFNHTGERLSEMITEGLGAIGTFFHAGSVQVFGVQDGSKRLVRQFVWFGPGHSDVSEIFMDRDTPQLLLQALIHQTGKTKILRKYNPSTENAQEIVEILKNHIKGSVIVAPIESGEVTAGFMLLWASKPDMEWPEEAERVLHSYCQLLVNLTIRISEKGEHQSTEDKLRHTLFIERQLNDLKSRFVSMASHKFRTPLAQILTAAESVKHYRNRMADDEIDNRLQLISEQIKELNAQLNRLIKQSSRDENMLIFKPKTSDLVEFMRTACKTIAETPEFVHQLEVQLPNHPIVCSYDANILQSVVSILVSNAANYSAPRNPIQVNLNQINHLAVVTICDKGIGIPEKEVDKVFNAYYRASNLNKQRGLGLGLPLAKDAILMHKGNIEITSTLDAGTTVTFNIPI